MKWLPVLACACCLAAAQQPPVKPTEASAAEASPVERDELRRALTEANNSPLEILRAVEKHLARYPDSVYRPELEHHAAEAAIAIDDNAQVVRYGEMVLVRKPDDAPILAAVSRALLAESSPENAERALTYARRSEELARQMQKSASPGNVNAAEWRNRTDRALGRALVDEARAAGKLGRTGEALATAQRAFEIFPNAESAREIAFWYDRLGKPLDAARALADAFTIEDAHSSGAQRALDRGRMGELYRQATGSAAGLGDTVLEAYDRNLALIQGRELRLRQNQPNAGHTDPMEFTLSAVDGPKLALASLKGKVLVLDIWATWCVPCREQHPIYEQVKQRFRDNPAVVFLSINTDSDHQPVKGFLAEVKWQGPVYFEDGLSDALSIDSIPATIVIDRRGQIFTRMNGYVKELFADQLSERIRDALAVPAEPPAE